MIDYENSLDRNGGSYDQILYCTKICVSYPLHVISAAFNETKNAGHQHDG